MSIFNLITILNLVNSTLNPNASVYKISTYQENQVIYSLNEYITSNIVKQGQDVPWGPTSRVQSSYILIRQKSDGKIYLQITISGQFAYGGYFKFLGKVESDYKYIRMDETSKQDYIFINFPLAELSESQKNDESIVMKLLNYQTSYGMLLKF